MTSAAIDAEVSAPKFGQAELLDRGCCIPILESKKRLLDGGSESAPDRVASARGIVLGMCVGAALWVAFFLLAVTLTR